MNQQVHEEKGPQKNQGEAPGIVSEVKSSKNINLLKPKFVLGAAAILLLLSIPVTTFLTSQRQSTDTSARVVPPTQLESTVFITLDSPIDGTLVTGATLPVRGRTIPNATITLFTESHENFIESDDTGYFEGTIQLTPGINTLTVTVFGENDEEKSITLDVVNDQ